MPQNEEQRLAALRSYYVLDTVPEEAFDRITRLASNIFNAPIALVSLLDANRQWFKSHHGIDATESPRDFAFCGYTILDDKVMVVPNALLDERFKNNPLVVNYPHIRFYAGAPLTTPDGYQLGSLCVIDNQIRETITDKQRGILQDLAAMVVEEMELYRAENKARLANEAKSLFIANISHEIRTPMNAIMGFADMLMDSPLSLEQRQQVSMIRNSGEALLDIINDVLDISKIEAGRLEIEHVSFRLRSVVEEVLTLFSLKAAEKYLPLISDFAPDLPEKIIGDPYRIRQVLMNLISNAIKFTQAGHVKVHLSYTHSTQTLHCSVEDTDIGIKSKNLGKIFDDFTQEDMSVTRHYGGTGLGLSICKRLIDRMGGTLKAASTLGKGSCFSFTLHMPLDHSEPPPQKAELALERLHAHVLVVEDQLFNQKVARYALEKIGCTVDVANGGREALKCVEEKHYDIIFMDVQMPDMDGRETTRCLRSFEHLFNRKHQIIIAMTASVLSTEREACFACGMDDFISKPLRLQELRLLLHKHTAQKLPS